MDAELERRLARRRSLRLRRNGSPGNRIHRRLDLLGSGRLVTAHPGVYLVGGAPLTKAARLRAATLVTGGLASHRSAAHLLHLIDVGPSRPEITIGPTGNNRGPFITHRSADLVRHDT